MGATARGTARAKFAVDSLLEESGFEPLVPLRPGRFSEHHSRVVTAPSSIRKAGYAQACAARDGQRTCRGPSPPHIERTFTFASWISLVVQTSSGEPPSESAD
jgi:hypothetical protein